MTDSPPGWHPDPRGRHEHRYWDGSKWTDHVADSGVMSTDPVAEVTPVAAPVGPSMVNLPAISPAGTPEPQAEERAAEQPAHVEPQPAQAEAQPAHAEPDTARTEPQHAQDQPQGEPFSSQPPSHAEGEAPGGGQAVAESGGRSPDLAALLSVIAPGSGHLYLGATGRQRNVALGLLAATAGAVVLAYFNLLLFIVGALVWLGAAAYALYDLRAGLSSLREAKLPTRVVGIILVAAGAALILSLLLPWYRLSFEVSASGPLGNSLSTDGAESASGFTALSILDFVLVAIGAAAVVAGLAALGRGPISTDELPSAMPIVVGAGAVAALLIVVFRMIVDPVEDIGDFQFPGNVEVDVSVGRAPGILLAASASIALIVASASVLASSRR